MSQNRGPVLGYETPTMDRAALKSLAFNQRAINLCILTEILLAICQYTIGRQVPILALVIALIYLGVAITAAVFLFRLAISVHGMGVGILLGILSLIPLIGLLILLSMNGKATKMLRQHGIKVGLLGADPGSIS